MTPLHLQQWMEHPETLDRDTLYELRTLVARYPYFQTIRLLYLKNLYLLHDLAFGVELRKAVLYVADCSVLFYLIEGDHYALHPHLSSQTAAQDAEEEPDLDRTLSLIDAFLSTIPTDQAHGAELDYAMDYTSYLLEEDSGNAEAETISSPGVTEVPKLRGQDLIDGFLRQSEEEEGIGLKLPPEQKLLPLQAASTEEPEPEDTPALQAGEPYEEEALEPVAEDLDDSCFTETLAKIYIKQQRYSKALEIIQKLSLNYPKKNAYFADQIRFLEKLIINAKSK